MRTLWVAAAFLAGLVPAAAGPVGTAFTNQGRLSNGGAPAAGAYDLQFRLFDSASGTTQVGPTILRDDLQVVSGLFATVRYFGAGPRRGQVVK
jgi:hypothetical protein